MAISADGDDTVFGDEGNDTLYSDNGSDKLWGGEGNDALYGGNGGDTLYGEAGDDTLRGEAGDDTLEGGEGNDTLYGGDGNDVLDGGAGTDHLDGGYGNDTYLIHRDERNTVYDYEYRTSNADTLRFIDIAASEVRELRKSGDDLVICYGESGELTLKSHFRSTDYQIERLEFSDEMLGVNDLFARCPVRLSEGNDSITLTSASEVIYGLGGHDTVYAANGDDTVFGGEDNDTLYGGNGSDTLYGEAGDDTLSGEAGNDVLDGGAGNDALSGGSGNDTYRFARGDGQDTIHDYDTTAGNRDSVQFGPDITAQALWFARQGNDLTVRLLHGQQETISITNWFASTAYQVEEFKLGDGSMLQSARVQALVDAMANLESQAIEETNLPEELLQIIGASWELPDQVF
jgi:Ca2+-binding RTX toxin-like protein